MKSKLIIDRIKSHTPEWHAYRMSGIGGSEIGSLMGLLKWKPAIKLFYEKCGMIPVYDEPNEKMFHGRNMEDYIANLWKYWNGSKEGMMSNHDQGIEVRKCQRINGYIRNPDYPWLFASIDRIINKGQVHLLTGEAMEDEGILECKQISQYMADQWESGIPIYQVAQVQQYMTILELKYGDIAALKDGNNYEVYPMDFSPLISEQIITQSQEFWDKVLLVRENKALRDTGQITQEEFESILVDVEPDPDHTEAYKEFMSDKYTQERERVHADFQDKQLAIEQEKLKYMINFLTEKRDLYKNTLTNKLVNTKVEYLDITDRAYVRYYKKQGGKNYQLDIRFPVEEKKKIQDEAEAELKKFLNQ